MQTALFTDRCNALSSIRYINLPQGVPPLVDSTKPVNRIECVDENELNEFHLNANRVCNWVCKSKGPSKKPAPAPDARELAHPVSNDALEQRVAE